jgi:hypothetical protein
MKKNLVTIENWKLIYVSSKNHTMKTIPKKTPTKKFKKFTLRIWQPEVKNHKIMLVQMILFPPNDTNHNMSYKFYGNMSLWKIKSIIMKNDILNNKSDTYNS